MPQVSDRGSHVSAALSIADATPPLKDSHRLFRDENTEHNRTHKEEFWFFRSKVKAVGKSSKSLPTVDVELEKMQRRQNVIEDGYRLQAKFETG